MHNDIAVNVILKQKEHAEKVFPTESRANQRVLRFLIAEYENLLSMISEQKDAAHRMAEQRLATDSHEAE